MTHTNTSDKGALRTDQSSLMFGEGFSFSGYERDPLYLNLEGRRFLDISGCSGIDSLSDGRAAVFADFDSDGDTDVFVTTLQGEAHLLFRNNVGAANGFLRLALEGAPGSPRDAFGAVVRVRTSAGTLTKIKAGGSGFLSQHDSRLSFGLGADRQVAAVEVAWPGAGVETFAGPFAAGSSLRLRQGTGKAEALPVQAASLPDPLNRAAALARDLRVSLGQPFPDFPVRATDGRATRVRARLPRGRRALVNVWATWCVPCKREMPELEARRSRLAARGIDLMGLNVDTDATADVEAFARALGVTYPTYSAGEAGIAQIYSGDAIEVPLTFLLDEAGTLVDVLPGWSDASRRRLDELLGGEPPR